MKTNSEFVVALKFMRKYLGIAQMGKGGGLNACPDGWGTFLEKNVPSSNEHLLDFGGV